MFTKEFLQGRVTALLQNGIKGIFPTSIKLKMPYSKGSKTKTKSWTITAMVTELSQDDSSRLSVENTEYRTVDVFKNDLLQLKSDNPSAYIVMKNFQKNVQVIIDGKEFKIREERDTEGYEMAIRFICERSVM